MSKRIQKIRGMNDILPVEIKAWQYLEQVVREHVQNYGYQEIRFPIMEKTELFKRSVGEVTDIVAKEMYTFDDRNGDSLSLRPEGTASCVRAGIENGLFYNQIQRLWYQGPLFRHERPQKGRYRQFHQVGVEAFGMSGAAVDVEIIALSASLWKKLGLLEYLTLELNTLGSFESRLAYRDKLVAYFEAHREQLDEDSERRLYSNPLRILDSKNPALKPLIANAPKLMDDLDEASREHFDYVCQTLDQLGIDYQLNTTLVRGLDYYCHTVFEWTTEKLGAQGTVCAGGRYDGLVEQLGGKATPAIGFAMGIERLVELLAELELLPVDDQLPAAYMVLLGTAAQQQGLQLAEQLRQQGLSIICDCTDASMKAQLKKADASQAHHAIIIGESELAQQQLVLKPLRGGEQQTLALKDIDAAVQCLSRF